MEGMDVFLRGKKIFAGEGCLGCHQARGVGGIVGPDLTEQGEKTKHE
jgi:mono/diheme cytochrome c family protein